MKKISIIGEVCIHTLEEFMPELEAADGEEVEVTICSPGGDVAAGGAIYELLRTYRGPVRTFGLGEVSSIAVLIFSAGYLRTVTQGTRLLIHDGDLRIKDSLLKARQKMNEHLLLHEWYCEQIANRSGLTVAKVLELASGESFLSADEAVALNLVDDIQPYTKRNS